MNRFVRTVVVVVLASLVVPTAFALPIAFDKGFVAPNVTAMLTVTCPNSGPGTSVVSATVGGGDVFIVSVTNDGQNTTIRAFFTVSGAPNPAPVEFTLNSPGGPLLYTGNLNVNPVNGAPNIALFTPVTSQGQTATVPSQPVTVSCQTIGGANLAPEVFFINANLGVVIRAAPVPTGQANEFSFTGSVPLNIGLNGLFVHVSDINCPTCNGTLFAFGVDFAPAGQNRTLVPAYIGAREAYHNEACVRRKGTFGGGASATTGCPPEPRDSGDARVRAGDGPDDGVNFGGGGPCGSYWHLELLNLPGRGLPLAEGISYNSNITLGPNGHILGYAPWSLWWTQRV